MKLSVVGAGYVGLVVAACLSEAGHNVVCYDNDLEKIQKLKTGIMPIYEPNLGDKIKRAVQSKKLNFVSDLVWVRDAFDAVYICVGTPGTEEGRANTQYVFDAIGQIVDEGAGHLNIIIKSTVPVGTNQAIIDFLHTTKRFSEKHFSVISNPEFLAQGSAIKNFLSPDRIVVGVHSEVELNLMRKIYLHLGLADRIISVRPEEAEMIKYASNAFLAMKISFMNELACLCDYYKADVLRVREGMVSDARIEAKFTYPGSGYGGSCFPKDVQALIALARDNGFEPLILEAIAERNRRQKNYVFNKVFDYFGKNIKSLKFALWGVTYKANTNDVRESPAIHTLNKLLKNGARVVIYDPIVMPESVEAFEASLVQDDPLCTAKHADALIIMTDVSEFSRVDLSSLYKQMTRPIIFDSRQIADASEFLRAGFEYYGVGRQIDSMSS